MLKVGSDIGAICRKCGDVWHVVVAVADGRIAKVECKQCGGRHRYRAPEGERAAEPARRRTTTRTARKPATVEADTSRPPRPYRPTERYEQGDRLVHPNFGEGVVQSVSGPTKVRVRFINGEKTLVQAREAAS
jgi:predicted  nucleic acid-binding Zn-ribbon protein